MSNVSGLQYHVLVNNEAKRAELTDVRLGLFDQLQQVKTARQRRMSKNTGQQTKEKERNEDDVGNDDAYRVQSIDLLRIYPTTVRAIPTIPAAAASKKAGARGGSTDGTAERAHLRLGRALARLPCGLEGLEGALHLPPRRRVPRLELGLVRVYERTRVLHARGRLLLLRLGG